MGDGLTIEWRLKRLWKWISVMIDEDRDPGPLEEFEVEGEIPFDGTIPLRDEQPVMDDSRDAAEGR